MNENEAYQKMVILAIRQHTFRWHSLACACPDCLMSDTAAYYLPRSDLIDTSGLTR